MLQQHADRWQNDLEPALQREGFVFQTYKTLNEADRAAVDQYFLQQVFPILTPLAVDPGHPFPFISNLSKSLGVMLEHPSRDETFFIRLKVPENLPRWYALADRLNFIPLEQVIAGNMSLLFPGLKVREVAMFRVTRNADVESDAEDADDLLEMVEHELRLRRMAKVVRLELPETMSPAMRDFIVDGLDVQPGDVYPCVGFIDMDDLAAIANLDLPKLKFKPWVPLTPPRLVDEESTIFDVIRAGDLLVHHPYESFHASVERFIAAAVADPKVLAIKMTLYRTGADTSFVPALIRAAEMGKQVAVLVEVKARFDEERNLELAQRLETRGVHVVYGIVGLKTHSKLAMVVRQEPEGLRTYCHIGTGNYNGRTAVLYTDLGLFTANPAVTDDVIDLFHFLTGRSLKREYRKLLIAPVNMRERFLNKIRREAEHARAGRPARIVAKMNALQDPRIITALYDALPRRRRHRPDRPRLLLPPPPASPACPTASASSPSSAASSNTPASSISTTTATTSTTSAPPTGCTATSTTASKPSPPWNPPPCATACAKSSTRCSPSTATPGSSTPTAPGTAASPPTTPPPPTCRSSS